MSEIKGKKILFFPWSHGAGFGYVGRLLKAAEDLTKAGYECIFSCDTSEGIVSKCGYKIGGRPTKHNSAVVNMGARQGAYIPINDLDTVYGITRYYHQSVIEEHLAEDLYTIKNCNPDLIVVDMQPTASIAARISKVPLLSIGDSDFYRDEPSAWMPWLDEQHNKFFPYPSCVPAFNAVLQKYGLPSIKHVSDILWGDLTLIASVPAVEQHLPDINVRGPVRFVGPVYWDPPWSKVDDTLKGFGDDGSFKVYITLGHGGKFGSEDLLNICEACNAPDIRVFTSLGFRPPTDWSMTSGDRLRTGDFTGITSPIKWSDLVISHGGYSTVMASLLYGKPGIIVPYMSEQEANGISFVEKNDAGFVLRKTLPTVGDTSQHFEFSLRHSGQTKTGKFGVDEVKKCIDEIRTNKKFKNGAQSISAAMTKAMKDVSVTEIVTDFIQKGVNA